MAWIVTSNQLGENSEAASVESWQFGKLWPPQKLEDYRPSREGGKLCLNCRLLDDISNFAQPAG